MGWGVDGVGRAATPLSDREVAELRAVPDAKTAGEAKASSSAGRGNSATVPDPGGPPSPTAGRRRKAPAQSLPAGSLSLFSRPDARATAPPPLPPPQQPGVEPDWPGSQVFGFGYNAHGQLGCGDTRARATPQLLRELGSISLTSLACGSGHSVAIDAAGGAHAWGDGASGQLGTGDRADRAAPELVRLDWQHGVLVTVYTYHSDTGYGCTGYGCTY